MFYKTFIRPLLFRLDPEKVHHLVSSSLQFIFSIPGMAALARGVTSVNDERLKREVFGLKFKNPVGVAAGFDKDARLFGALGNLGFGFVEVGTITPKGQSGNEQPRLFRLPSDGALINRMGFNNEGMEAALHRLKKCRKRDVVLGGNLGKNTLTPNTRAAEDYLQLFETLIDVVDYFVVNVSCPNISDLRELQDKESLQDILSRLQKLNRKKSSPKPILLKVSPDLNFSQLDEVIELIAETGIAGVVAVNTTVGRKQLRTPDKRVHTIGRGGLSGKPLQNRALEVVRYLSEKSGRAFPIVGVGGIFTPEDALQMLDAGASLVQVYTGFIYEGPFIAKRMNKVILKRMDRK
jgi:dihydroorotate dehydrogenase